MKADSIEIVQDGDKVFGLYCDGNLLIKDDAATLSTVRDNLASSLAIVDEHLSALHSKNDADRH